MSAHEPMAEIELAVEAARLIDRLLFEKLQDLEMCDGVSDISTLHMMMEQQIDRINAAAQRWFKESLSRGEPATAAA